MLVGMVALTGQFWLDHRKINKEEVAAHLVNLAWNGLSGLETRPVLGTRPRPAGTTGAAGAGRAVGRGVTAGSPRGTRSTGSSRPGAGATRPRRRPAGGALPGHAAGAAPRPRAVRGFARHGLEGWEFDVLAALRRSGPPYQLSPGQLVAQTMVTSGTMTNRIDRLGARLLVRRLPDPADGRGVMVRLEPGGQELVDAALADLLTVERDLLEALEAGDRATLADLLRQLTTRFDPP
jgi:DNA-binding MarR family transcriptional regulator